MAHGMPLWGVVVLVLGCVPFINAIALTIAFFYLGFNGGRLALERRKYESIEQFQRVEGAWDFWGGLLAILVGILLLAIDMPIVAIVHVLTST